jgi:O-methyltransferase
MWKLWVRQAFDRLGFDLKRKTADLTPREIAMVNRVKGLTATSPQRIVGLMDSVRYVVENRIPGAIVECGVWRGGSIMVAAATLLELGDTSREIYLFDTFQGMSEPTERDKSFKGELAADILSRLPRSEDKGNSWCVAGLEMVRRNVLSIGYPEEKIHFVEGKVEDTIPGRAPEQIALLRLDTDWYESTRHELLHLYPRLAQNGVLIVDDYGSWHGAREAVDEYFAARPIRPLFSRMDDTGRLVVKPAAG